MAVTVYTQPKLLVGGYDITADFKSLAVNVSAAMLDATAFGNAGIARKGGLFDTTIDAQGMVNLASCASEPILFANLGLATQVVTAFPNTIVAGSTTTGSGYAIQAVEGKYQVGGQVGTLLPITVNASGAAGTRPARAWVLDNSLTNTLSTSVALVTNGTAYQYAAVSTCEALYAGFHMTALTTGTGVSVTAVIQSASSSGFATPSARASFSAQSCKASQWFAPIDYNSLSTNHTYWRVQYTLSTGATANALTWMSIGPLFY